MLLPILEVKAKVYTILKSKIWSNMLVFSCCEHNTYRFSNIHVIHLHSSSTIVTVVEYGSSRTMPKGNEVELIVRLKVSSNSALLSLVMRTENGTLRVPFLIIG